MVSSSLLVGQHGQVLARGDLDLPVLAGRASDRKGRRDAIVSHDHGGAAMAETVAGKGSDYAMKHD